MEELRLQEKVRVYALARELNIESKDLLDMCKKAGFDVKNQLSSLEPEQRDAVVEMIKKASHKPAAAPASGRVMCGRSRTTTLRSALVLAANVWSRRSFSSCRVSLPSA